MLLNERAMQAMLNDVSQVDYDIPGEGSLLETLDKLSDESIVLSSDDTNKVKENPIKGIDFSLAIQRQFRENSKLRRIAKQLTETISS